MEIDSKVLNYYQLLFHKYLFYLFVYVKIYSMS